MAQQPGKGTQRPQRQRWYTRPMLLASVALIAILSGIGTWAIVQHTTGTGSGTPVGTSTFSPSGTQPGVSGPVSRMLFGTNLSLFDNNDQVLNSPGTLSQLQKLHTSIIRMPVRSSLSEATEIRAAQLIKSIGASALLVLRGAVDSNTLADDTRIIKDMNRIFGNSVVYYEYGNEEDLLGVNVTRYTNSWNAIVPQLKRVALNGHFIGPVNFQYDRDYLTSFLKNANPRPNEISWHEYTCNDSWSNAICISHIDHWTSHISDARSAMRAAIGTALPIMITEWNYAPNAVPNDGKNNDSTFMSTWTTKALQTLAANRVFASMQYACTNTAINLISGSGAPTVQGNAFQTVYQHIIVQGQQPAPVSTAIAAQPTPTSSGSSTPTTGSNGKPLFSFEDGSTDGWSANGAQITAVQNSSSLAQDGKRSLEVTLTNLSSSSYPYVSVSGANMESYPQAGQTLSASIYLPSNSVNLTAKLFMMDNNYQWHSSNGFSLTPGTWTHLTYTIPTGVSVPPRQLGIQFSTSMNTPVSTPVYVDAVGWS